MPDPIDVDDIELDEEDAASRRPGLLTRLRRRLARSLRRGANRLRSGRDRS
jgi:hypothetical protein